MVGGNASSYRLTAIVCHRRRDAGRFKKRLVRRAGEISYSDLNHRIFTWSRSYLEGFGLTSHLDGLKTKGSSYFSGFKCTAGGQTITAQPAGMNCRVI